MRMKPQDHFFSWQSQPNTQNIADVHVTPFKARRVRFCHTFLKHVLVLKKYNSFGRLKQFFNKKP